MHGNVPVRFGRGRLDSLGNKGLAAYLMCKMRPKAALVLPLGIHAEQDPFLAPFRARTIPGSQQSSASSPSGPYPIGGSQAFAISGRC